MYFANTTAKISVIVVMYILMSHFKIGCNKAHLYCLELVCLECKLYIFVINVPFCKDCSIVTVLQEQSYQSLSVKVTVQRRVGEARNLTKCDMLVLKKEELKISECI